MANNAVKDEKMNTEPTSENVEEGTEGKKKKRKKSEVEKTEEEKYVDSLTKEERRDYNRRKRALRRSQWVAEYWIIIVLAVAVFVVFCVLMIINYLGLSAASFFKVERIFEKILR